MDHSLNRLIPETLGFEDEYVFDVPRRGEVKPRYKRLPVGADREIKRKLAWEYFSRDPLHWCISQILNDPADLDSRDHAMLLSFLDDHLSKESTSKDNKLRVDQRLSNELSDFAATHQLLKAVRYHRPIGGPITLDQARELRRSRKGWRNSALEGVDVHEPIVISLGKLLQSFDEHPMPMGTHDNGWLDRADQVRRIRKEFWDRTRACRRKEYGDAGAAKEDIQSDLASMSFDTDPKHLASLEAERAAILAPKPSLRLKPVKANDIQTQ